MPLQNQIFEKDIALPNISTMRFFKTLKTTVNRISYLFLQPKS